ncbi:cytochrome c and c1 heme-lyase [Tilletiaria anomala UBC 951]|uniref:Holocytochrome c-type synthase n=1 Tax=Tilletiaria anomala (strain ATCC 24038 / CBS 436.72 / UBC 951) TaxID=1037660 RepID=A0A066VCY7_TILAU|nr:cytochrome c and c1 heme-lyase [Tilletiaria anomala UBC 951]KDN39612.1 cytochrome c and c1 heme-lyase [Tilletiaria anomala UBC 951]
MTSTDGNACPVDHDTRQVWLQQQSSSSSVPSPSASTPSKAPLSLSNNSAAAFRRQHVFKANPRNNDAARAEAYFRTRLSPTSLASIDAATAQRPSLSQERVISSIPRSRTDDSGPTPADTSNPNDHWVYPSPSQFFNALQRKNHNPQAADMTIVVPIHNAVNERAWQQINAWENHFHPSSKEKCGGIKLISFQGKPKELTWKAWAKTTFLGYMEPFDRHDWLVDRCGQEVRYIIDFYTGKSAESSHPRGDSGLVGAASSTARAGPSLSFYLDVRPAPDSIDNLRMRASRLFAGPPRQQADTPTSAV